MKNAMTPPQISDIPKTEHEPFLNNYAEFKLRQNSAEAPIHVFDFKLTKEPHRTGTVMHDMMSQSVEMRYSDGTPVDGADAPVLADALLCWLRDNGYLDNG